MTMADFIAWQARRAPKAAPTGEGVEREADLHDQIERELKRRSWYYVHSRMDRATTQRKGVVDFIIAVPGKLDVAPRTLWLEAKGKRTKITPEQIGALAWLDRDGHETAIVRSLPEFLAVIAPNNGDQR